MRYTEYCITTSFYPTMHLLPRHLSPCIECFYDNAAFVEPLPQRLGPSLPLQKLKAPVTVGNMRLCRSSSPCVRPRSARHSHCTPEASSLALAAWREMVDCRSRSGWKTVTIWVLDLLVAEGKVTLSNSEIHA